MDTLSMIIAASILTVIIISGFLFRFYMKKKRVKFETLRSKKYGGCPLTEKEHTFLSKNSRIMFNTPRRKTRRKQLKSTGIKETFLTFSNKLNPWYSQCEQLKALSDESSRSKIAISDLRDDLTNLKHALEILKPKKEMSVPEYIRTKQRAKQKNESKSALDNVGKSGYSKFA